MGLRKIIVVFCCSSPVRNQSKTKDELRWLMLYVHVSLPETRWQMISCATLVLSTTIPTSLLRFSATHNIKDGGEELDTVLPTEQPARERRRGAESGIPVSYLHQQTARHTHTQRHYQQRCCLSQKHTAFSNVIAHTDLDADFSVKLNGGIASGKAHL